MKLWLIAFTTIILCTAGVLVLHWSFPSLINNEGKTTVPDLMDKVVSLHNTHPAFAGRPFTTLSIRALAGAMSLSLAASFTIINFTLLALAGLFIFVLAQKYHASPTESILTILLFFTSFPILFAFFRSIDSYDDPLQYVLLLAALYAIHRQKNIAVLILLLLATLARETTILAYPGIIICYFFYNKKTLTNFRKRLAPFIILGIIGALAIFTSTLILKERGLAGLEKKYLTEQRFTHWRYNFQNKTFAIESLAGLVAVLGLPLLIIARWYAAPRAPADKIYMRAIIITAVITIPVVLASARAREARLFALPLLFWWPLFGSYLKMSARKYLWPLFTRHLIYLALAIALASGIFLATFRFYHPTYAAGFERGFQLYVAVYSLIIVLFVFGFLIVKNLDRLSTKSEN